jgi:transposase
MRNISRTLNVSSSAVAKTIKRYDETGSHEDRHRKGRPRLTSAAEDEFIRLFRGDCVNQAFMVGLLQRNHY